MVKLFLRFNYYRQEYDSFVYTKLFVNNCSVYCYIFFNKLSLFQVMLYLPLFDNLLKIELIRVEVQLVSIPIRQHKTGLVAIAPQNSAVWTWGGAVYSAAQCPMYCSVYSAVQCY